VLVRLGIAAARRAFGRCAAGRVHQRRIQQGEFPDASSRSRNKGEQSRIRNCALKKDKRNHKKNNEDTMNLN